MYSKKDLIDLIDTYRREYASENEWLEFKENNDNPEMIGEYISALSNGAALKSRPFGYLIYGIDDSTHEVVGTNFDYKSSKKGNEELENWLHRLVLNLSLILNFMR